MSTVGHPSHLVICLLLVLLVEKKHLITQYTPPFVPEWQSPASVYLHSTWAGAFNVIFCYFVEIRVVRLGSFQNLYLSFAIVEITHGVTANRDDTDFHHAKPQIL